MATFDLNQFIDQPSVEGLGACRKNDLFLIAQHYEISVTKTQRKAKIKSSIMSALVHKGVFPQEAVPVEAAGPARSATESPSRVLIGDQSTPVADGIEIVPPFSMPKFEPSSLSTEASPGVVSDLRLKVRLARLQLETQDRAQARQDDLKRQIEMYRIDADTKVRLRQVELQAAQSLPKQSIPKTSISLQDGSDAVAGPSNSNSVSNNSVSSGNVSDSVQSSQHFDVAKNIAIVPPFREKEVEAYFQAFERIASALKWPTEVWALMLQCKLTGKAQDVCASLSLEESVQYDAVKNAILRGYELVPEHYRQRFRTTKKSASQTYVEFAREKGMLFDRWIKACKVTDYTSLRELILIEEFKNCVPERTALYLNEQKVSTVQQAAVLADEYALMHKTVFVKRSNDFGGSAPHESVSDVKSKWVPSSPTTKSRKECSYCHKLGHLMADCHSLKRKNERQDSMPVQPRGTVLVKTVSSSCATSTPDPCFQPFVFDGFVSLDGVESRKPVRILRDTGGSQSFILSNILDFSGGSACETSTIVQGIEMGFVTVPLHRIWVTSELASGCFEVAVRPSLPVKGIDFIMGNDIAGGKVMPMVKVTDAPCGDMQSDALTEMLPDVFSISAVTTRAQAKRDVQESTNLCDSVFSDILGNETFPEVLPAPKMPQSSPVPLDFVTDASVSHKALMDAQKIDPTLQKCRASADEILSPGKQHFYWRDAVLMRKWSSTPSAEQTDDWNVVHQIVLPSQFRQQVLNLAHDHPWSGHLGINKTYNRVLQHFFWPGLKSDVIKYCKTCHICQVGGKPNQVVPPAPLCPIPAVGEPFERVLVDCVGPLPRARSGCQYLLTIMCVATRFPEAIPLRSINARSVTKALTKFFTTFGLPKTVQTDRGSNFLSRVFRNVLKALGVSHVVSSAYHPESQGALERWHQTLKSSLRKYCLETGNDWEEGVPFVLFAVREARQDSLGFSPSELVFGHNVRGPLKMLKEEFLCTGLSEKTNILDLVSRTRERLHTACSAAEEALARSQKKMKRCFDRKAVARNFQPGEKVLVLIPTPGSAFAARFSGPYVVKSKVNDTGYVIHTPERRRKTRLCHINMLKPYLCRPDVKDETAVLNGSVDVSGFEPVTESKESVSLLTFTLPTDEVDDGLEVSMEVVRGGSLKSSEVLSNIHSQLSYLSDEQQQDIQKLLDSFPNLFCDVPPGTNVLAHDINVGNAIPIKQHAYRCPVSKREEMKREVMYLLQNGFAVASTSPWSSPCLLVPKSDGSVRFCTDFRRVNSVTVPDAFPLPRIDDCIDNLGVATYITKLDLLKGYWQVPLTERASEISAFVTPDSFLQYTRMAFGLRNAPATFQRLMSIVLGDVPNCNVYLDDVVIYSSSWADHLSLLRDVFHRLSVASLTLNLKKCEFAKASVTYLGKQVGNGQVRPLDVKVTAVLEYPIPTTRRELRRFLGMVGYYRCFCKNFSSVVAPLTRLCSPKVDFIWTNDCHQAFLSAKSLLCSAPVLSAPDVCRAFQLEVDASAVGAGAVLLQEGADGIAHPVSYFSSKFNRHQLNYSTIEKETLALLLALQHFNVYVGASRYPVMIYTDHNPLVFLSKMYNHNQRLMRWALMVQPYNLEIRHKKGSENVVADALSRG